MAVIIKTKEEIEILREGGKRLAEILKKIAEKVAPGISTQELNDLAENLIRKGGDEPAFLNYKPEGAPRPYPASLCVSVNNEVVHGIPSKNKILKEGDIVSLDLGIKHRGLFTDSAITVPVGKITRNAQKLLNDTKESLMIGIAEARAGQRVGDIGYAIESFLQNKNTAKKYGIVRELSGHGVGRAIHEDPYIPNFGKKGTGEMLREGMVIALEPMVNLGGDDVIFDDDGYTVRTADASISAHFEHTILITDKEAEILTQ